MSDGWIGVDLDGTLATYDGWKGPDHIGEPIQKMLDRVVEWLKQGREVRIFTARVYPLPPSFPDRPVPVPEGVREQEAYRSLCAIGEWCKTHIGGLIPVTCVKDYGMVEFWDDRAVQVVPNTGERADGKE